MCFFPGPLPPPSTPTPRLQWLQEGKLLVVGTHGDAEQMVVSFGRLFGSVLGGGREEDGWWSQSFACRVFPKTDGRRYFGS